MSDDAITPREQASNALAKALSGEGLDQHEVDSIYEPGLLARNPIPVGAWRMDQRTGNLMLSAALRAELNERAREEKNRPMEARL